MKIMKNRKNCIKLGPIFLSMGLASTSFGALIVDFTAEGSNTGGEVNGGPFVFSTTDPSGLGVSFDLVATAVVPMGGGANGGAITSLNGGLGSEVENTGAFLNVINGVPEVLRFTVSNVMGLSAGQTIVITNLLSQNGNSTTMDQTGGFGGTFGNAGADSITIFPDSTSFPGAGTTGVVVNQSDVDLGSILLATDSGNTENTGNTFAHAPDGGDIAFTSSFDVRLTDLGANNAIVIQGFEFNVIPEPSSFVLVVAALGAGVLRRRR